MELHLILNRKLSTTITVRLNYTNHQTTCMKFDIKLLSFILACFNDSRKKTKISLIFSDFLKIRLGVLQCSRHGHITFAIHICEFFALQDNILMQIVLLYHSYTTCVYNFGELIGKLEKDMSKICN